MLRFLLPTILFCLPFNASAQWGLSCAAGFDNAFFEVERIPSPFGTFTSSSRFGPCLTASAFYHFNDHWSLSAGVGVRQVKPSWGFAPQSITAKYNLTYFRIPVELQIVPTQRWFLSLGFEGAMLGTTPVRDEIWKPWDYGFTAGAGIKILPELQFGLGYYLGAPRVVEGQFVEEESQLTGVYYLKNRSFRVTMAYLISLEAKEKERF